MPPYRAVLVVDMAKFSSIPSGWQPRMSAAVPTVLDAAFDRAGLAQVWKERLFPQGTGDGYIVAFETDHLPRLIHPLLPALQEVLEDQDRRLRAADRQLRMRLRASIHVGPLPGARGAGQSPMDGIGKPMNDAHRLIDSLPVRAVLDRSNPDVTLVAAIISQRVYEDVVEARYTSLHPHELSSALVKVKEHESTGWLYVPRPSTDPAADPLPDRPAERSQPAAPGATTMTFGGTVGQAVGTQHGDSIHHHLPASRPDGDTR